MLPGFVVIQLIVFHCPGFGSPLNHQNPSFLVFYCAVSLIRDNLELHRNKGRGLDRVNLE